MSAALQMHPPTTLAEFLDWERGQEVRYECVQPVAMVGVGWSAPTIVFGSVLGIVAIVLVAAGAFGWTAVLEPVARFAPASVAATPAGTAIFALALLIAVKWVVAIGMATTAR